MKNKIIRGLWICCMLIIALLVPCLMEYFLTTVFVNAVGGSDDGWLGFWGGYLGAIISISGVYYSVKQSQISADRLEKVRQRPVLMAVSKNQINAGQTVYHSLPSIDVEAFMGPFYEIQNLSENPAKELIVVNLDKHGNIVMWLPFLLLVRAQFWLIHVSLKAI